MAIRSFTTRDKGDTENCFWGDPVSRKCPWRAVYEVAREALIDLHAASDLKDLRAVAGYRLELLGSHSKNQNKRLAGFYSIRINNRWRVVFRWAEQAAVDAEVVSGTEGTKTVGEDVELVGDEVIRASLGQFAEGLRLPEQPSLLSDLASPSKGAEMSEGSCSTAETIVGGQADEVEIVDYH